MGSEPKQLMANGLVERGFCKIGRWTIEGVRALTLSGALPAVPGVYAFAVDGLVHYIGVASRNLAKRLRFYRTPGPTQTTNIRLKALLLAAIEGGAEVEIYAASPPDFSWMGWVICGPEGLEASLIRDYAPAWNRRGTLSGAVSQPRSWERTLQINTAPSLTEAGTRSSKYDPLRQFLASCGKDKISLTFAQIQDLVGPLPKSASLHQAWWGNHEGNVQARSWMGARYMVEAMPSQRTAIFRKFSY